MEEQRISLYQGKSITKFEEDGAIKGDSNFVSWENQPEKIFPFRFFLEDIITWEVYSDPTQEYKLNKNKEILLVSITRNSAIRSYLIIEDLDVFDLLMDEVIEKRKNNINK